MRKISRRKEEGGEESRAKKMEQRKCSRERNKE